MSNSLLCPHFGKEPVTSLLHSLCPPGVTVQFIGQFWLVIHHLPSFCSYPVKCVVLGECGWAKNPMWTIWSVWHMNQYQLVKPHNIFIFHLSLMLQWFYHLCKMKYFRLSFYIFNPGMFLKHLHYSWHPYRAVRDWINRRTARSIMILLNIMKRWTGQRIHNKYFIVTHWIKH